ncbi:SRPBCC family protein [Streptomyces xylophagus]|uniref:SRPBCC family protein n=1 Tax=Streptomyces xylophagus TaxID=285514 RepID=UPI0005BD5DB5|nr:SRPBCC family protein [Streptomyces xylophagus]
MQLTNTVPIKASPDDVFALMNDVERVASCMPGATLDGQDGDTWRGRVKIRVGPISASYAGTVRFLEIDAEKRRLRVHARGTDTHGSGDAEAEVSLDILAAPEGALLQLSTDLVIRGKIVQFGKGAIVTVSDRILQQFARNLGSLLDQDRVVGTTPVVSPIAPVVAQPAVPQDSDLDGLAMLLGPRAAKYGLVAGAFALGVLEGWLLGRLASQARELRALRRTS